MATNDYVTLHCDGSFTLHGRVPGVPMRGCSLPFEGTGARKASDAQQDKSAEGASKLEPPKVKPAAMRAWIDDLRRDDLLQKAGYRWSETMHGHGAFGMTPSVCLTQKKSRRRDTTRCMILHIGAFCTRSSSLRRRTDGTHLSPYLGMDARC